MRWIYNFIFMIFALVSIPKFLLRLNQAKDARQLIRERFGIFTEAFRTRFYGKHVVWLHAVSVGEVMAARPWIELFLARHPHWLIALSTTTPTGQMVASQIASEKVAAFYAPFDLSFVVRCLIRCVKPRLILLMETEIWPNLISEAKAAGVPVGVINGRISSRAFVRYQWIKNLIRPVLRQLSFCLVQTERDQSYFLELGMPEDKIRETGNLKFDHVDQANGGRAVSSLREKLVAGRSGLILVGGSTSSNEEEILLRVFGRLRKFIPDLRLILAPRHPEHLPRVIRAVQSSRFDYALYSQDSSTKSWQVLLIDKMGMLASVYALADLVFIGGSLNRRGGQNPIEAASAGKALLHGPNVFNFDHVYRLLDQNGAAWCVRSEEELFEKSKLLLERSDKRKQMGELAYATVQSMKGATQRTLDYLSPWVERAEIEQAAFV